MATLARPRTLARPVQIADRWFRACGLAAVAALGATAGMLAGGAEAWRVPFVLAHLAALLALVPLGFALVARAFIEARAERGSAWGAISGVIERYPLVTTLVAATFVTAAVSLSQFEGVRWLRSAANLATVALVVTLVVRYLRSTRT
ncbi:MAG: hypothetical protein GEU80_08830 [Dehalococcoidia bacterium]|nr:hypothetical protein [Dehalococcoidia bacterium]